MMPLGLVLVVYAACLLFINPFYEYPVGDDWAYAQSSKTLFEDKRLVIPDPSIASLIFQTVWSYPFLWVAGRFSFAALHMATITLFVLSVGSWYLLLLELGFAPWLSAFGTALLVFNPFVFPLSATFQTDVPSLALMLGAMYGYTVWFRSGRMAPLIAGSTLSACSILVRQTGIVVAVAALLLALSLRAFGGRPLRAREVVFLLGPPVTALLGLYVWVTFFHGVPLIWKFHTVNVLNVPRILRELLVDPFEGLHYLAFFMFPGLVVLACSKEAYRSLARDRRFMVGFCVSVAVMVVSTAWVAFARGETMPYFPGDDFLWREFIAVPWGSVTGVTAIGGGILLVLAGGVAGSALATTFQLVAAGPRRIMLKKAAMGAAVTIAVVVVLFTLRAGQASLVAIGQRVFAHLYETRGAMGGTHTFTLDHWLSQVPPVYEQIRLAVLLAGVPAVVGLMAASRLLQAPISAAPRPIEGGADVAGRGLVYLTGALSLGAYAIIGLEFGRNFISILPAGIVLVLIALQRVGASRMLAGLVMLVWASFSALNADAVIQFHGAAWRAHQSLLSQGLSPRDIDPGTYTLIGWYIDLDRYRLAGKVRRWWVVNDLYRIRASYQVKEEQDQGYDVVSTFPFTNYLGGESNVVVLKRREA